MTKLASRIATGIAILGLAAPAFAATTGKSVDASAPASHASVVHHSKAHKHTKVAQADSKNQTEKKSEEKKVEKKNVAKGAKSEKPAVPSATPAPASK